MAKAKSGMRPICLCGDFVYDGSLAVAYILTPNGQLTRDPSTGTYTSQYNIPDHLGNVRSVVSSSGTVLQSTDYYPFGLAFSDSNIASNRYLYNGKELEDYTLGTSYLGTLDYGARHYDPRIARWTVPDPMAEKYYGVNAYGYCAGNPVMMVDPEGSNPFVVALIKGAIGAMTDLAAQLTIKMSAGEEFREAITNVDYTSVGASFVVSALSTPGITTATKLATTGIIAVDAAIDVNLQGDIQTVGGFVGESKTITETTMDIVFSVAPGKCVNSITSGFNKAVQSDLSSKAAATLTKEAKTSLKKTQSFVNSMGFQTAIHSMGDYSGKLIGGQVNETMNKSDLSPLVEPVDSPIDATRIVKYRIP